MKVLPHHMPLPPVEKNTSLSLVENDRNGFLEKIKSAVEDVNRLQLDAEKKTSVLAVDENAPIHETMIALEKADISFRFMARVRNRVLEAYQEIMRMPI
ncbi:MAG: flagellar hook-basal body complex protein FliE [Deltaproteobacteria bacterium]|nr:flagellar hook-basal body complex protein FliE [Deltaproteobacteria bacterium]